MSKLRVIVVDDHPMFRQGIVNVINREADMEVVGEASDGLEALVKARQLRPDMILMDISMPGCDGLEGARLILREQPDVRIVMLTARDEDEKLFEAIKSGAKGYLLKTVRRRQLIEMLRAVQHGEAAITPALAARMMSEFRRLAMFSKSSEIEERSHETISELTRRQRQVLQLVAQGASDKEIAEQLTISLYTVKAHMRAILNKLQVNNRHEAAQVARASYRQARG